MKRDVAIIGGGPAAIYAAYEFALKYPDIKVVILEEGHAIDFRNCPIIAGKTEQCVRCTPCSIMRGFGGAGAFSDGKYNFTTEFGGWLSDYLPKRPSWNSLIMSMKSTAATRAGGSLFHKELSHWEKSAGP